MVLITQIAKGIFLATLLLIGSVLVDTLKTDKKKSAFLLVLMTVLTLIFIL